MLRICCVRLIFQQLLTCTPPPLRINRSMENVGNVIRRTASLTHHERLCFHFSTLSSFLSSSVQVWWVTRTTHTASLRTSKAAELEQFHRQHDELGFGCGVHNISRETNTVDYHPPEWPDSFRISHFLNNKHDWKKKIWIYFALWFLLETESSFLCWTRVEA